MAKCKKIKKLNKLLAISSCVILVVVILEITLRLAGAVYLNIRYSSNPIKREKEGLPAILCLGDSFTQGFGASRGKSYPEQLIDIAKEKSGKRIPVYKEFRINSSTILKHLESDIDRYRPDLIIIMTGCNDTWSLENLDFSAFGGLGYLKKMDIWLSNSRVYKLIKISFLNLKGAIAKEDLDFIQDGSIASKFFVKSPEARKHYDLGEGHFYEGDIEMALAEFKEALRLEPCNPLLHWRLACIYNYALHEYDLAKDEARFVFMYGDSSIIGEAFVVLRDSIVRRGPDDDNEFYTAIKDIESIIDNTYESKDKVKARRYLERLISYYRNNNELKRVFCYNLKEILRITRQNRIKLVLMQYPIRLVGCIEDSIKGLSDKYDIPLVDNYTIFEDRLVHLKEEDLFARDGHCNASGYKLIAENVCQALIKEGMISSDVDRKTTN